MILPALSLTQPWCEFVLDHGKDIENRRWNCHKRGVFLIHAAKGMTNRGFEQVLGFGANALGKPVSFGGIRYVPDSHLDLSPEDIVHDMPSIPMRAGRRGGLVGAAEILDVIPRDEPERSKHPCSGNRWLMDGCFGFVLGRRVRLPFRPMNGRQRWFNVELLPAEEATLRAAGLVTS